MNDEQRRWICQSPAIKAVPGTVTVQPKRRSGAGGAGGTPDKSPMSANAASRSMFSLTAVEEQKRPAVHCLVMAANNDVKSERNIRWESGCCEETRYWPGITRKQTDNRQNSVR